MTTPRSTASLQRQPHRQAGRARPPGRSTAAPAPPPQPSPHTAGRVSRRSSRPRRRPIDRPPRVIPKGNGNVVHLFLQELVIHSSRLIDFDDPFLGNSELRSASCVHMPSHCRTSLGSFDLCGPPKKGCTKKSSVALMITSSLISASG